jgi:hypothetical protein
MAGLYLARAGLLMGGASGGGSGGDGSDGDGSGGVGVRLDAAKAGAGHTLSEDDRTLINTGGGSDYRHWVPALKRLPGTHPVPFYWEIACAPGGPAQFNGYAGVVSQAQLDDPGKTFDSGENPVHAGSICYRGNGDVWGNTSSRLGSHTAYGAGDIVMLAFDPASGGLWIGVNGAWQSNPATDPGTETSDAAGGDFRPVLQGREPGEGGTLRSLPGQFSYPVPGNCIALGHSLGIADGVAVQAAAHWIEMGGTAALSVARVDIWHEMGGGTALGLPTGELWHEIGGGEAASAAAHELWIERS